MQCIELKLSFQFINSNKLKSSVSSKSLFLLLSGDLLIDPVYDGKLKLMRIMILDFAPFQFSLKLFCLLFAFTNFRQCLSSVSSDPFLNLLYSYLEF